MNALLSSALFLILALVMVLGTALADDANLSTNTSQSSNLTNATPLIQNSTSFQNSTGSNSTSNASLSTPDNSTAVVHPLPIPPAKNTTTQLEPEPEPRPAAPAPIISFDVQKLLPGDVRLGDSQVNILVSNTGNQVLTNINAVIAGEGISVYNQEPIRFLSPGDSKWILAWINTKKTGKIPVDIRIQDRSFRLNLNVVDVEQTGQAKKSAEEAVARRRRVREIQDELSNLSDIYEAFQRDYTLKQSKGFVLTTVNLQDAKTYLRTAQSSLAKDELADAGANIVLLRTELTDVREKLASAQPKPRTWKDPLKENVALLSGVVGVLVGGLAVYEKFKSKHEDMRKSGGWFGERKKDTKEDGEEESGEE